MAHHAIASSAASTEGACNRRPALRRRAGGVTLALAICVLALTAVPALAAEATAPCPNEQIRAENNSLALPDCRAYELISPVKKNGYDAGAPKGTWKYGLATADGNGILYASGGPFGESVRGLQEYTIGFRTANGWSARSAPPPSPQPKVSLIGHKPIGLLPSADLGKLLFASAEAFVLDNPTFPSPGEGPHSTAIYLADSAGSISWLTRPQIPDPSPAPGYIALNLFQNVGASPGLDTVYFWGSPTLLPTDVARAPNRDSAWGLYEYSQGILSSAGTLPDGTEDPGGAAPASSGFTDRAFNTSLGPEMFGNQVSRDGLTLYFVSPDPGPDPSQGPLTQLYVRRAGHSRLVSHAADGSPAPHGVQAVPTMNGPFADGYPHQFAFASPDGSSAVFQSTDALSADAPTDSSLKAYRYDLETGSVEYFPGVGGSTVVAASDDGQRFLFNELADNSYAHIDLWDHGTIRTLSSLSSPVLAPARATASGSVFVFTSAAPIPGYNTGFGTQVYRYDVDVDQLTCVSCPPDGVAATGAILVNQARTGEVRPDRGISGDGGRVFFQTADPLVSGDINGVQDVYEWTPDDVSLISGGHSPDASFVIDNSADGDDVFFATSEGLDPRDTDDSYDVYDARVGGGFPQVAPVSGCDGNLTCKGSTSAPPTQPGSATDSSRPTTPAFKFGALRLSGGVIRVKVTAPGPAAVSAGGKGLVSTRHAFPRAGAVELALPLRAASRETLRTERRLRLEVHLRFAPSAGAPSSARVSLTVKTRGRHR